MPYIVKKYGTGERKKKKETKGNIGSFVHFHRFRETMRLKLTPCGFIKPHC